MNNYVHRRVGKVTKIHPIEMTKDAKSESPEKGMYIYAAIWMIVSLAVRYQIKVCND